MLHPAGSGEELLLSRLSRGPPDEEGRPTFQNHTAVVPSKLVKSGRLSLFAVDGALKEFQTRFPGVKGETEPLEVALEPEGAPRKFAAGLRSVVSRTAMETLATRRMADRTARSLLLCRETTTEARNTVMLRTVELLNFAGDVPIFTAMSDAPTASALNYFNLVVAPRGVRADHSWALIDAAMERPALERVPAGAAAYAAIERAYSEDLEF